MNQYTPEQVEEMADLLNAERFYSYGDQRRAVEMLRAYAVTLRQPSADSGRVGVTEAMMDRACAAYDKRCPDGPIAKACGIRAAIEAALAAQGQGEAVAHLTRFVDGNGMDASSIGMDLAGVPDDCRTPEFIKWLRSTAHELHVDPMDCCGPRANHGIAYALDDLADALAAAPSAPEGDGGAG